MIAVQFQHKPHAAPGWLPLGAPDTQEPFEMTFDPAGVAHGQYDLRAIARDNGGEDPAPTSITVTFGDTTPPPVPAGLVALVTAAEVHLTWTAVGDADLQGYHVYRGEDRLTSTPISTLSYDDLGRSVASYLYRVERGRPGREREPAQRAAGGDRLRRGAGRAVPGQAAQTSTSRAPAPASRRLSRSGAT